MQSILKTTNSDHTLICHDSSRCQNIYSPRGSLVRFQRKKLLILDLNGLLAGINQDYHNAHLAHAKVRTKLGKLDILIVETVLLVAM